ncbi:MAG: DUF6531 domain-containing protein [Actinobacteria bacterium]|nr:DUF6531 domain-containing protein [Actinomycetota bacterium]
MGGSAAKAIAAVTVVVLGMTLAPPNAQALEQAAAQSMAERVVADARRQAASPRVPEVPASASAEPEVLAETTLRAASGAALEADVVGVSAEFSGNEIADDLSVSMTPAGVSAEVSAASQLGGTVLGSAVEIDAVTAGGEAVTEFPAEVTTATDEHGVESAVNVVPGITLGFDVDKKELKRSGVDASSLRIYTRETDADTWQELPSYYDAEAGKVVGESDHLSQFVVIGVKFVPPPGPRIVLDPDDDYGWAETPAPASELTYNVALANQVAAQLAQACLAQVVVTRQADVRFVSGATRAAIAAAHNPVATVTLAFDALTGSAWGTQSDGGSYTYSRGGAGDSLQWYMVNTLPSYTGRPAGTRAANGTFPDPAFSGVPGAMLHVETLYLDHNYDRAVIDNGFASVANGVMVGVARYAESLGYNCTDPVRGGLPAPPSQAELERWRQLGHQNYQTYGADPVSFSTGNLVEDEPIFTLDGPGAQVLDFGLTYNSRDGRLSRVGAGWSFGLGGRAQRFDDGSVLVVRGDGASYSFTPDGVGGYQGEAGLGLTLTNTGAGTLVLQSDRGETWRYDASDIEGIGELTSFTDRQGNTVTLAYGAPNDTQQFVPLVSVTDSAGQNVTVQNDALGRVASILHPDGRAWQLAYDAAGNLASITAPDGGVRAFTYDSGHQMLTATDALGITYLRNEYDSAGRVVKQWDAEQNLRTFAYGNGATTYTNNEGKVWAFEWDAFARITGIEDAAGGRTEFEFNTEHRVTNAVEPGGLITKYEYDAHGNVVKETRPDGGVWRYTWTQTGELVSQTDPEGRTTTHEVNGAGLRTKTIQPDGTAIEYAYNTAGDLTQITWPSGAIERYTYDTRGNLTERISPAGRVTSYEYDTANRLVLERDGAGVVTRYEYDAADNLTARIDGGGNATRFTYNRNGHVLTETAPDGGVTSYTWDDMFRMQSVTDPEGGTTRYEYNAEDALTKTIDPLGAESVNQVDPLGRVTRVTDPLGGQWQAELDAAGRVTSQTDAGGATTNTGYDAAGQVTQVTDPEGGVWKYAYDAVGNLTSQTDPNGAVTSLEYDLLDRVTRATDADGRVTEFEYDADGGLIAVIDSVGETTGFVLDADGVTQTATNALGETTTYTYDSAGRVASVTDAAGTATAYGYDAAGRLVTVTDGEGGVTTYEYDPVGRVTAVIDADGHRSETRYDLAGRVTAIIDGEGGVTSYGYDAAGHQTSTLDADGRETRYEYDAAGQLVAVVEGYQAGEPADDDVNVRTEYTYTPQGSLDTVTDPNGGVTSYEYDLAARLTSMRDAAGAVSTYFYDAAGRETTRSNGAGQSLKTRYTPAGVVTGYTTPAGEVEFEHDGAGRPIVMHDSQGVTAWQYDKLGRVASETGANGKTVQAAYDGAGRVAQLTLADGDTVDYEYDLAGRLISQQTPWGDQAYAWSKGGDLTSITRGDGVRTLITNDRAGRVTRILHAEPAAAPKAPEPRPEVVVPKQDAKVCPAGGPAGYLDRRELKNLEGEDQQCVKTGAYLGRRTLPAPADPVGAGGALQYDYTYTAAGNVQTATRTLLEVPKPEPVTPQTPETQEVPTPDTGAPVPGVPADPVPPVPVSSLQLSYGYDGLGRLASAVRSELLTESGAPEPVAESSFAYDAAGNRTHAETVMGGVTRTVTQQYGDGNRLLSSETVASGESSVREYGYDGAGRRTSVRGAETGDYSYGWGGQPTTVSEGGVTTSTGYDGLGRAVTRQVDTAYSSDRVTNTYLGGTVTGATSVLHGDTSMLWGALGRLEGITSDSDDTVRWALLDRLGSVVAEATGAEGANISELVSYAEYGEPLFESVGYQNPYGFTGQLQDGGTGRVSFASRDYDPGTAAWFAPDEWPGLLVAPQSLNRYAYVLGNPATYADAGGFRPYEPGYSVSKNGSGWQFQKEAPKAVLNHSAWANHYGRQVVSGWNAGNTRSYAVVGPSGQTQFMSARHATATRKVTGESHDSGGRSRYEVQGSVGKHLPEGLMQNEFKNLQKWAQSKDGKFTSAVLGTLSLGTGLAALSLPETGPFAVLLGVVSIASGIGSTAIDCIANWLSAACALGVTSGAVLTPFGSSIVKIPLTASRWARSWGIVFTVFGIHTDTVTTIAGWGDWWEA